MVDRNTEEQQRPYLSIFESELHFIASNAAKWAGLETGGELYGLFSHMERPVIFLATGPAEMSTHDVAHFAQDVDHFRQVHAELNGNFGVQLDGEWHSHHFLGLREPSDGDQAHIASIAARNRMRRLVEIIVTCDGEAAGRVQRRQPGFPIAGRPALPVWARGFGCSPEQERVQNRAATVSQVDVHAYYYADAKTGEYEACPIRVISGMSPIRQALLHSELLRRIDSSSYAFSFPLEHVHFQPVQGPENPTACNSPVVSAIAEQLEELPSTIRNAAEVVTRDRVAIVVLPLTSGERVQVAVYADPPFNAMAVQLLRADGAKPVELAKLFSDMAELHLPFIYQRVARFVARMRQHGRPCRAASVGRFGRNTLAGLLGVPKLRERSDETVDAEEADPNVDL